MVQSAGSSGESNLASKNVLILGATSGIGRATALAFAREGVSGLTLTGRRESLGLALVEEIRAMGFSGQVQFIAGDVVEEAHLEEVVKQAENFGPLTVAFNNAGIEGELGPLTEVTSATFDQVFGVNVRGLMLALKHQLRAMLAHGQGGSIINNGSIVGTIAFPHCGIYTASKHAVLGLTKTAALEYGRQGIRVNAVSPGPIGTDMLDRFSGGNTDPMAEGNPMGRIGRPTEIAEAVLYLASDRSPFINGTNLIIDGGYTAN
jgi:NAD(P)-dependent dehydrogenase (short-subunit alcohol dehydrogenase family)